MNRYLFEIILIIFAAYGFISIISNLAGLFLDFKNYGNPNLRIAIIEKNQEDRIEYIIRSEISRDHSNRSGSLLTVVDMGSTDDTGKILDMLKKQYRSIEILGEENKERVFELKTTSLFYS